MPESATSLEQIQAGIDRYNAGEPAGLNELLSAAAERLRSLAHRMLGSYPRLRRFEQTDDVLQNASLRLMRSLQAVPPQSAADFLRLAALNIRRELLDLVKHHYGPQGAGPHRAFTPPENSSFEGPVAAAADLTRDPARLSRWTEFHQQVEQLPEEERQVFDLLWYQGLTQAEAARLLSVTERTIKRRWQAARLRLHEALKGDLPW